MRFPQRLVPLVLAGLLTIAGCTSSEKVSATTTPTPSPADLVSGAVTAMAGVTSAHFVIAVTGTLPDLEVQSAEGDLKADGSAQGKAAIKQFGQLIEIEFIEVDKDLYLKGATGGYTKLAAALADRVYDPTTILKADAGVSKVLSSATDLAAVTASGGDYVTSGTVPKDVAASLTPGMTTDVTGTFHIAKDTSLVGSVEFATTGSDGAPATVSLQLSDFNKAVTITAPGA